MDKNIRNTRTTVEDLAADQSAIRPNNQLNIASSNITNNPALSRETLDALREGTTQNRLGEIGEKFGAIRAALSSQEMSGSHSKADPKAILGDTVHYEMRKNLSDYWRKLQAGMDLYEHDVISITFSDREIYNLFDVIHAMGRDMLVSAISSEYDGQELVHTYTLQFPRGISPLRQHNEPQTGCSLAATVKAVRQDMVQIELHGDAHQDQQILTWFPYSTVYSSPDGTGFYCMPEIGDVVRLHVPERSEQPAYVASAVHLEHSSARKNPDVKSIMNKHKKEIRFTPDSLVITNNAGMSIEIVDGDGIHIISDKNISIASAQDVTIASDSASVLLAGSAVVSLQQSGAGITLDGDINVSGGELRIH